MLIRDSIVAVWRDCEVQNRHHVMSHLATAIGARGFPKMGIGCS